MATIEDLKRRVDLPELALWLGCTKAKGGGANKTSWHSPNRPDKNPSLSIFRDDKSMGIWRWKDHASGEGGTCIDFVMYVRSCDLTESVKMLHQFLGIPLERPAEEKRSKSTVEYIAEKCLANRDQAVNYLVDERKIPVEIVDRAIARGTVGFNTWTSPKAAAGEVGHGGPAAAFIVRSLNPSHVVAVDLRYLEPALNGGVKTMSQGEKAGYPWCSDWQRFEKAHTVHVVESAVNALTVEAAGIPGTAAIATRGTATVESIDWRILQGKQAVLGFDVDAPFPPGHAKAGYCAGAMAAWRVHELLTGLDISALMLDQADWEVNDLNDLLKAKGQEFLRHALARLEPWLIPGRPARSKKDDGVDEKKPRPKLRVFLPAHDDFQYGSYRVRPDFTSVVSEEKDEEGAVKLKFSELAGFRVASLSRVKIASATSTMTGDPDAQPTVMFSVSVQAPRHGAHLVRRVIEDEKLHNVDVWKKFGPVFSQGKFLRMVNILERTAHLGARNAINFVGVAWRDGRLVVNEGPNCYFIDPRQQCPYSRLTFPSGPPGDARTVIDAYQRTFHRNAGSLVLVWALGAHLKALLGFWPHLTMQAEKGSGKSTFTKHLERTIAMTMFSGQSIETPFRILTSLSHTSHPVGWEEISARNVKTIDFAISMLQEAYQYTNSQRGAEMKEFLVCAPVLLAGEDVPVRSLVGKIIRTELDGKKGELLRHNLPRFPVRQWLEFITGLTRQSVLERYDRAKAEHLQLSRASGADAGAVRMAGNYAAISMAWELLCEFAEIDAAAGGFKTDLVAEMNSHIGGTSADREPWVWIMETLLSEIATGNFRHPYTWDTVKNAAGELEECLLVRTSHVMDHLANTSSLRDKWNSLPVKSDRVFKRKLKSAGIQIDEVERSIGARNYGHDGLPVPGKRVSHLSALSIERMRKYGLHAVGPDDRVPTAPPDEAPGAASS